MKADLKRKPAVRSNFTALNNFHVGKVRLVMRRADGVEAAIEQARAALPKATLVWRTTNSVCDGRFSNRWSAAARAYHCTPISACGAHEAAIRRKCENRYNVSCATCDATFMDRQNTRAQRERSLAALRGVAPPEVTSAAIYRGAAPFVIIQLLMIATVAALPWLATALPGLLYD